MTGIPPLPSRKHFRKKDTFDGFCRGLGLGSERHVAGCVASLFLYASKLELLSSLIIAKKNFNS